jgi:glycerol-3-phosphate cytidylyltransferase
MKIGFTASSFDMLHAGHILMLEEAKNNCDYLIVGFNVSPENKNCIQTAFERYTQLKAIKYVDEIIPYSSEEDLINLIKSKDINVRFLGEDYLGKDYTGKELNIPVIYTKRKHSFSSSNLVKRIKENIEYKKKKN